MRLSEKIGFAVSAVMIVFIAVSATMYINTQCTVDIDRMIAEGKVQETENGYVEELTVYSEVEDKSINRHRVGSGRVRRTYYWVSYYNEELGERTSVDVGDRAEYDKFSVGDKVKVTRLVYYTKQGLRLNYKDFMELVEEN